MNRREFTQLIVGGGVAATVPLPVAAQASSLGIQRGAYTWAVAIAHAKSKVSPEMIVERLGVSPSVAQRIISRMAANGVVDAPNAAGTSRLASSLLRVRPEVVVRAPGGGISPRNALDHLRAKASEIADQVGDPILEPVDEDQRATAEEADVTSVDDPAQPTVSDATHSTE